MKKYITYTLLTISMVTFLASCKCKSCTKESENSVQVCKENATDDEYNQSVANLEALGYSCK